VRSSWLMTEGLETTRLQMRGERAASKAPQKSTRSPTADH